MMFVVTVETKHGRTVCGLMSEPDVNLFVSAMSTWFNLHHEANVPFLKITVRAEE